MVEPPLYIVGGCGLKAETMPRWFCLGMVSGEVEERLLREFGLWNPCVFCVFYIGKLSFLVFAVDYTFFYGPVDGFGHVPA